MPGSSCLSGPSLQKSSEGPGQPQPDPSRLPLDLGGFLLDLGGFHGALV